MTWFHKLFYTITRWRGYVVSVLWELQLLHNPMSSHINLSRRSCWLNFTVWTWVIFRALITYLPKEWQQDKITWPELLASFPKARRMKPTLVDHVYERGFLRDGLCDVPTSIVKQTCVCACAQTQTFAKWGWKVRRPSLLSVCHNGGLFSSCVCVCHGRMLFIGHASDLTEPACTLSYFHWSCLAVYRPRLRVREVCVCVSFCQAISFSFITREAWGELTYSAWFDRAVLCCPSCF